MMDIDQGRDAPTAADNPAPVKKSEAQAAFDRMLVVRAKFGKVATRLAEVTGSITARPPAQPELSRFGQGAKPATFFDGLDVLVTDLDRIADDLGARVEGLAKLF